MGLTRRAALTVPPGLLALALGGFGIGLAEFVVAALLPQIAIGLRVSVSAAGWLISAYALTVTVAAIAVTAVTSRWNRKHVLFALVVLFGIGNLLCAMAPNYPVMLIGRMISALCHGSFFGIGSLVARSLAEPRKESRAVAVMFSGLTLANVMGVPFGALVGHQFGWRATFWALTGIGVLALIGIAALIPHQPANPGEAVGMQLRAFRSVQVWLTLAATALSYGGMFGAFTYMAYTVTRVGDFSSADLTWLLVVFGTGLVIGNLVGGRAADHDRDRTLVVAMAGLTVTLATFGAAASSQMASVPLLFLTGLFGFATVPGFITRVTDHAKGVALAASANVSASNVGIALGSWLGGRAISAGFGYRAPLYVGAVIVLSAVVVMTIASHTPMARHADSVSA